MNKLIHEMPKNSRELVRFTLSTFKGKHYLDVRTFITPENGGEMLPTKKGLTLAVELYPTFKQALAETERVMVEEGVLDAEDLEAPAF
ncbi:MAG: hypothetical protein FJ128_05510 [Deltaproteobacteria bacterium]|nr:hypothetical protein [Deltaproteobacteria bacterium]